MCETRVGKKGLKGLVIVTGFGPVAKDLADVAVGPILALSAVVDGVWRRVGHLHLCGTVLGVMEVEAVADVTEKSWRKLLLCGLIIVAAKKQVENELQNELYCRYINKSDTHLWTSGAIYLFTYSS